MINCKNAIFLLIALVIECGCSKTIKKVEVVEQETCKDYYDIGAENFASEDYSSAIAYLERAIECSTEFVDAHMLLGDAYFICKDYERALEHYRKIELNLPESSKLALMKGRCYRLLGEYKEATEEFLKVIKKSDDKLTPYSYLILMSISNKDFETAQKYLHEAFTFAPDDAQFHVFSGDICFGLGEKALTQKRFKPAIKHYKSARVGYEKALDDPEWGSYATKGFNRVETKLKMLHLYIDINGW